MKYINFQLFSIKFVSLLVCSCFIPIVYTAYLSVSDAYGAALTAQWVLLIAFCTIILLAILSIKFINEKLFLLFLLLLAFFIRLIWIYNIDTRNVSDFEIMYNAAVRAAKGDFGFSAEGEYFIRWAYQMGFTMYQALVIYLFGDNTFILKLLNILYSTGTTCFIYLIAKRLFNDACGRIAGVSYALFIPSIAMSSVLSNQHIATFMFYLSFYLLISRFRSSNYIWILVGFFLSLGDLFRPLGSLILIAVGIYIIVVYIFGKDTRKLASTGKLAGIFLVYYLTHVLANTLLLSTGVTQYTIANREPLWKFVTGLNYETKGIFSDEDADYLSQYKLGDERNEASKQLINERIADKPQLLTLFKEKFIYMWTERDGSLIWGLRSKVHDYSILLETLTMFERWMYLSMGFFIFISTLKLTFDRKTEPHYLLFLLLITGYMAVHLLIEIQTRYRYFIIPSFTILQSYGVYTIYSFFKGVKLRKSSEKVKV